MDMHTLLARLGAAGSDGAKELGLPVDPIDRASVIQQLRAQASRMSSVASQGSEGSITNPKGAGGPQGPHTGPQFDLAATPILALMRLLQKSQEDPLDILLGRKKRLPNEMMLLAAGGGGGGFDGDRFVAPGGDGGAGGFGGDGGGGGGINLGGDAGGFVPQGGG